VSKLDLATTHGKVVISEPIDIEFGSWNSWHRELKA
jgi:hypothetical protein